MGSIERCTRGAAERRHTHAWHGREYRREWQRVDRACWNRKSPRGRNRGGWKKIYIAKRFSVLGRPGSDLLFQVVRLSTIGAWKFNGLARVGSGETIACNTSTPATVA